MSPSSRPQSLPGRVIASLLVVLVSAGCTGRPHEGLCPSRPSGEDEGESECPPGEPVGRERLWPLPGELYYAQLGLSGASLGEAALLVGPAGDLVLIDVGNDSHDDNVRDFVDSVITHLNEQDDVEARPEERVTHIVLTHFHADHADGIEDLLEHYDVLGHVIHRGFVDLTDAANRGAAEKVCAALSGAPDRERALCRGEGQICREGQLDAGINPAVDCAGLEAGDLEQPGDSGPSFLSLGADTRLTFLAANGTIAGQRYDELGGPIDGVDSNGENARSLVGLIQHGDFRLLFAGDLTGGGSETDPVEAFLAPRLSEVSDLDGRGVDVLHLGHHGRRTSSSEVWLDATLPADGCSRNAVAGVSNGHWGSPQEEVVERVLEDHRLGEGFLWTTDVESGVEAEGLIDASGGSILIRTFDQGRGYFIQAIDDDDEPMWTEAYLSVRRCDR